MNVSPLTSYLLTIQAVHQHPLFTKLFRFLCKFEFWWPSFDFNREVTDQIWHEILICHTNVLFVNNTLLGYIVKYLMRYFTFCEILILNDIEKGQVHWKNGTKHFLNVLIIRFHSNYNSNYHHELRMECPRNMVILPVFRFN